MLSPLLDFLTFDAFNALLRWNAIWQMCVTPLCSAVASSSLGVSVEAVPQPQPLGAAPILILICRM